MAEIIRVGEQAPDFTLDDHNDKPVRLSDMKGKNVLLSFHPLAWTGVCSKQMKSLDKNYAAFKELNTVAFGMNIDSVPSKKAWAKDLGLKHTRLLSDFWPHGEVARSMGIFREHDGFSERANILLDGEGKVIFSKVYEIGELPDIDEILDILRRDLGPQKKPSEGEKEEGTGYRVSGTGDGANFGNRLVEEMDVAKAIEARRAYRSLDPVEITDDMVKELARCANLAPSCNNFQPERFVFVYSKDMLEKMKPVFNKGNEWCHAASLMIAVFSEKKLDCVIKDREYYLFGTGMAVGFLMLRATEMGLVAHPIAGYNPDMVKEVLGIPPENTVITVILVGKKSPTISPVLSANQALGEQSRPPRFPLEKYAFRNVYGGKFD